MGSLKVWREREGGPSAASRCKRNYIFNKWDYKSVHTAQGSGAAENGRKLLICLSKQKSNIVVLLAACVLTFEPSVK